MQGFSQRPADPYADSIRSLAVTAPDEGKASDRWLELSKYYRRSNLDSSRAAIDRAIHFARTSGDADRQNRCLMSLGALAYMQGDIASAEKHYLAALQYWESKGASVEVARCLLNLGNVVERAQKYDQAIGYLRRTVAIAGPKKEHLMLAQAAGTLSSVFYQKGQPDSMHKYTSIARSGFEALNDSANLARVNGNEGYFYRGLDMNHKARQPYLTALKYLKGVKEKGLIGEIRDGIGRMEFDAGNFKEAIEHFLIARDCFQSLKWHMKIAESEIIIGRCFEKMGRQGQAENSYNKAFFLSDSLSNSRVAGAALAYLGNLKLGQKQAGAAVKIFRRALSLSKMATKDPSRYEILMGLSKGHAESGNPDSASFYLDKAQEVAGESADAGQNAYAQVERARQAVKRSDYAGALAEIDKALEVFRIKRDAAGMSAAFSVQSECYEQMGNVKDALKASRSANEWKDSVPTFPAYEQLLALEAKYWSERKQHELEAALQNQALSGKEAQRAEADRARVAAQRNLLLSLLGVGIAGTLAAIFITRRQRQNKLERKLSELKMTALRAQMNPHFIFNALGSVQLLINTNNIKEANLYLTRFAQLLRITLERSDDSFSTLRDEMDALDLYIGLEALRFKFKYEINLSPSLSAELLSFPTLLIQPIVENAVKHGLGPNRKDGKLSLSFTQEGDDILCCIEDNGVGRQASRKPDPESKEERRSFGLQITRERLGLLQPRRADRMSIHDLFTGSGQPAGTRVEIRVPIQPLS